MKTFICSVPALLKTKLIFGQDKVFHDIPIMVSLIRRVTKSVLQQFGQQRSVTSVHVQRERWKRQGHWCLDKNLSDMCHILTQVCNKVLG